MLSELLQAWEQQKAAQAPPPEPDLLLQSESVTVFIDNGWGPPVPYPSATHEDGRMNHGYIRLKENSQAIATIPEVEGWPEYHSFLERVNAADTPIESVGCEKGFFPCNNGNAKVQLGSYTDLIFTDLPQNNNPINFLHLAASLIPAMQGSEQWWSTADMALQRSKGIPQCDKPWCFMLKISGHGRNEEEARQSWGATLTA
jgi:hypothetical protein